jgi:hypothetical protein
MRDSVAGAEGRREAEPVTPLEWRKDGDALPSATGSEDGGDGGTRDEKEDGACPAGSGDAVCAGNSVFPNHGGTGTVPIKSEQATFEISHDLDSVLK